MRYREVYNRAMTKEKKQSEERNIWINYVARPLSILATVPLLRTEIKPITVTAVSIVATLIGFALLSFGTTVGVRIVGWFFFFLWGILDGVDGNLARCKGLCSDMGALWDATGGYAALCTILFSAGIAAFHDDNYLAFCSPELLIVVGGSAALFSLFPRLIMQKKKALGIGDKSANELTNKRAFGIKEVVINNLISPVGLMQPLLLLSIIFHVLNLFTVFYFIANFAMMSVSLYKLLKS